MNVDGSGVVSLVTGGRGPTWSPDGSKIAFYTSTGLGHIGADGSNLVTMPLSGVSRQPSWSPDGTSMAAQSNGRVHVWRFATFVIEPISPVGSSDNFPDFSH